MAHKCPIERKKYKQKQYQDNKDKFMARAMKRQYFKRYGVTPEDWDKMYLEQDGCCKICGAHQLSLSKRLSVDHCHNTGKVRGLLCMRCNAGLGNFKDDPDLLLVAINYLKETV